MRKSYNILYIPAGEFLNVYLPGKYKRNCCLETKRYKNSSYSDVDYVLPSIINNKTEFNDDLDYWMSYTEYTQFRTKLLAHIVITNFFEFTFNADKKACEYIIYSNLIMAEFEVVEAT